MSLLQIRYCKSLISTFLVREQCAKALSWHICSLVDLFTHEALSSSSHHARGHPSVFSLLAQKAPHKECDTMALGVEEQQDVYVCVVGGREPSQHAMEV